MIFDTDVLIWALRKRPSALDAIDAAERRLVSVASRLELLQGVRDKRELKLLEVFLRDFEIIPLSGAIGTTAVRVMEHVALKTQLSPIDSLIAATAIDVGETLCTANVKHFKAVPELQLCPYNP